MPRHVITIDNATVEFGPTGTAVDFSCQVNSAALTPTANNVDVPATFCTGASQTAAPSSFALDLTFLQDWGEVGSVSQYLYDHDAESGVEFHVEGINTATGTPIACDGTCTIVAGQYGGEAGTPLQATVSLPCDGKPVIGPATAAATADEEADDEVPTDETEPNTFQPA